MKPQIKPGVKLDELAPQIVLAWQIACAIFDHHGVSTCVLTSANDGSTHLSNSLHYRGGAIDLRTKHISAVLATTIHKDLQAALGEDFDVIFYPHTDRSPGHIHIEYDPPTPTLAVAEKLLQRFRRQS